MNYLDLVQNFQIFVLTHPVLKTFSHGEIPAVNASTRSINDFPLLNVRLSNVSISTPNASLTQTLTFSIEVTILDVLLQDRSNEVYILNNLTNIIKDLYSQAFIYNNLTTNYSATPGPFYLSENLFGFQLSLDLEVSLGDAFCITPTFIENYDLDAINYLTAAGINDPNIINAYTEFVLNLKSAGFYNKLKYLYPLLGTNANSQKWNALNPIDSDSAFRLTFNEVDHSNKGIRSFQHPSGGNFGTPSAYASTHYNPLNEGSDGLDTLYAVYITEFAGNNNNTQGEFGYDFGAGTASSWTFMKTRTTNNDFQYSISDDNSPFSTISPINISKGFFAVWRPNVNTSRAYRSNTNQFSIQIAQPTFTGPNDAILTLLNLNIGTGNGVLTSTSLIQSSYKWIGLALAIDTPITDGEVQQLSNIVNNFMTSIGR